MSEQKTPVWRIWHKRADRWVQQDAAWIPSDYKTAQSAFSRFCSVHSKPVGWFLVQRADLNPNNLQMKSDDCAIFHVAMAPSVTTLEDH